jgi:bifunctional non-homologous end joining protein LigD
MQRLEARRRKASPFVSVPAELRRGVQWVEPDLVAQVELTEWTNEGRMRQPVFLGLRDDRDARHVVRERPGTVEGGGVDTVAAGRPWEALRQHATRTHATSGEEIVDLLGVRLTHPDRVYYPDLGFTKLDLALYYVSIADKVLPYLDGRPLTLVRCPDGIGGETFYQKHPGFWTPPQVRRFADPAGGEEHLFVDSVPGLVALAQAGILEIHPWNSRVARLEQPDQVIFDLDPDEALPFSRVTSAARTRSAPTRRARERARRSRCRWTGTSSTASRARRTSRSPRCRCASWVSARGAPRTRGRATSRSSSASRRRSRATSRTDRADGSSEASSGSQIPAYQE